MTDKVLDDAAIERAFRAAERRLASRDPDTLAGRFSPRSVKASATTPSKTPARQPALSD